MTEMLQSVTQDDSIRAETPEAGAEDYRGAIVRDSSPESLERIRDPAVELVVWERSLPTTLGDWLDSLPVHHLPNGRILVATMHLRSAIMALLDGASMPCVAMRDAFLEDVITLNQRFMNVMETEVVDLRLETLSHDGCWKFHRDWVPARMLTTYRGPGTEWVHPWDSREALTEQKSYRGPIEQFHRYNVGLFKGSNAGDGEGIVHRSPPVAETGISRLLLCLNLPSRSSPCLWRPAADS